MATPLNLLDLLKSGVVSVNDPVKELAHDTAKAQQKIQLVMRWLESNAAQGARAMVNKFNLAWSHEKTLAGGVALAGWECIGQYSLRDGEWAASINQKDTIFRVGYVPNLGVFQNRMDAINTLWNARRDAWLLHI